MKIFALFALCSLSLAGALQAQDAVNTLSDAEQKAGWKLLFDGKTLTSWRGYRDPAAPIKWTIENSCLKTSKAMDARKPAAVKSSPLTNLQILIFASSGGLHPEATAASSIS